MKFPQQKISDSHFIRTFRRHTLPFLSQFTITKRPASPHRPIRVWLDSRGRHGYNQGMNEMYSQLKRIASDPAARGVLAEIVATEGSSPRRPGARMLLGPDGTFSGTVGGGGLEYHAQQEARQVLRTGEPSRKCYSLGNAPGEATGAICGGTATVDFRPVGPAEAQAILRDMPRPPRVLLYGAGHVGKALADALHLLGMAVVVTDGRAELLTPERFPHAERRVLPEEDAPVDAAAEDLVAVMTRGHAFDYTLTLRAMRSPARYVGVMGSRKKVALFRERLLGDGVSQEAIDARLHSPIGLPIGAETPEEIAVSVAAEMIGFLRKP